MRRPPGERDERSRDGAGRSRPGRGVPARSRAEAIAKPMSRVRAQRQGRARPPRVD